MRLHAAFLGDLRGSCGEIAKLDVCLCVSGDWTHTLSDSPSSTLCASAAASSMRSMYSLSLSAANFSSSVSSDRNCAEEGGGA